MRRWLRGLGSWFQWGLVALVLLQLAWLLRIAAMGFVMPHSTAVQRSELARLWRGGQALDWAHQPVAHGLLPDTLRRAVVASEDSRFFEHHGVDWDALQAAWQRNQSAKTSKVVGGSTITQQLAKNLFLSGERQLLRKAQELVIAGMLELLLTKRQILDIYLNQVEWGEGVFGAEAAAQRYFREHAWSLNATQAARLAVMLPSPKRFEDRPNSNYLRQRSGVIRQRMNAVDVPRPQP